MCRLIRNIELEPEVEYGMSSEKKCMHFTFTLLFQIQNQTIE